MTFSLPCPWCDILFDEDVASGSCPLCGREPPGPTRDPGPAGADADVATDGGGRHD